jgi:hypothetical protein
MGDDEIYRGWGEGEGGWGSGRERQRQTGQRQRETERVTELRRETDRDPPAPSAGGLGGDDLVVTILMNVVGLCTVTESVARLKR